MTTDDTRTEVDRAQSSGWSATHLSPTAARFQAYVEGDPSLLARSSYPEISTPHPLLRDPVHPWPTFLGPHARAALAAAATGTARVLRRAPRRLHRSDRGRFDRLFGATPSVARALRLLELTDDGAHCVGRGDFYLTERGFQCLEHNGTAFLGGWEMPFMADKVLSTAPIRAFLERERLDLERPDVARALFRHVLRLTPGLQARRIAFWILPTSNTDLVTMIGMYLSAMAIEVASELGLRAPAVSLHTAEEFALDGSTLVAGAEPVDALIEAVSTDDRNEVLDACIEAATSAGRLNVFNGPVTPLLSSKINVALASEAEARGELGEDDATIVRAAVPWTRVVEPVEVRDPDGQLGALTDIAVRRRADLVLKPAGGLGGAGVLVGKGTDDATWAATLAMALRDGGWILQQYVEPLPVKYQSGEVGCPPHTVVWGAFVHGDQYAASFLRMVPQGASYVVNAKRGSVDGVVFDVGDD